jgi:Tfp pilus assembly protein PilX
MFRQLKNESGMVMLMVLMTIVVMMIFSIGVLSRTSSQTRSSEAQIDRIRAEQLAVGAFAKVYSDRAAGGAYTALTTITANLDGKTYQVNVTEGGAGINNTNSISVIAPF